MHDDRGGYGVPVVQQAPAYVVLFTLALGLGVTGELADCAWIKLPAFWIPLLAPCYYVAILLAAVGFGPKIGLGAAVLAAITHATVSTTACGQSISRLGEVAAFIAVGLVAGFLVKSAQTNAASKLTQATSGHEDHREISQSSDAGRGQIPVGFVQSVRAPLSAIESAGYVLEDSAMTDQNHREVATIILRECHRLDVLIRPLEFMQTLLPTYREVDLSSLLDQVVRRGGPLSESAFITLRKQKDCDVTLICDSDLVEQAVLNLLANAIRFVGQGEEILLSAHKSKNNAVIEISHRRLGTLGQLGIAMAAVSELHVSPSAVETPPTPEVGN